MFSCRCSEDLNAHLDQCLCKLDSCLSTELNNNSSVRFLDIYNISPNIFRCQRLKHASYLQYRSLYLLPGLLLRWSFISFLFCKCPCTVYRVEVELDTSDRYGSGRKPSGTRIFFTFLFYSFILCLPIAVYRIVIWCVAAANPLLYRYQPSEVPHGCRTFAAGLWSQLLSFPCQEASVMTWVREL